MIFKRIITVSILLLFASMLIIGCSTEKKKTDGDILSFDENDYMLVATSKDDLGRKHAEEYVNKTDKQLRLRKIFWENTALQATIFFKNNERIGPSAFYNSDGSLGYLGFYYRDKETGITIQYNDVSKKAVIKGYKEGNVIHQEEVK